MIENIGTVISEIKNIKKEIKKNGHNFILSVSNKDLLLWIVNKEVVHDKEIAKLKIQIQSLYIVLSGLIIGIIINFLK